MFLVLLLSILFLKYFKGGYCLNEILFKMFPYDQTYSPKKIQTHPLSKENWFFEEDIDILRREINKMWRDHRVSEDECRDFYEAVDKLEMERIHPNAEVRAIKKQYNKEIIDEMNNRIDFAFADGHLDSKEIIWIYESRHSTEFHQAPGRGKWLNPQKVNRIDMLIKNIWSDFIVTNDECNELFTLIDKYIFEKLRPGGTSPVVRKTYSKDLLREVARRIKYASKDGRYDLGEIFWIYEVKSGLSAEFHDADGK